MPRKIIEISQEHPFFQNSDLTTFLKQLKELKTLAAVEAQIETWNEEHIKDHYGCIYLHDLDECFLTTLDQIFGSNFYRFIDLEN